MPPTRDPFTFTHFETEDSSQKAAYALPTHLIQRRDPWNQLHAKSTLASIRRQVWYTEPEVSRDSLDFNLSSLYNHHEDLLKDKSKPYSALKGLPSVKERAVPPIQPHTSKSISVRHWINPVKESIHSIEGAIESPHTAATNSGYSRKENGGIFYH
ncbi:cilia- and flagella-associated protein 276 isoform X2 [Paroedura picta]|uniref:cilia- and flagella-associated protein 276 isoform X2 n=1 Tax=Paroedura picta TaxID=143630 RepID=UPI0040564E25